jgi:hypothetical protein
MEATIVLLQTEIIVISHLKNSVRETRESMQENLLYNTVIGLKEVEFRLEIEIINRQSKVDRLKTI